MVLHIRRLSYSVTLFTALFLSLTTPALQPSRALAAAVDCNILANDLHDKFPLAATAVRDAEAFAAENNLPVQIVEMGPEGAKRKRVFIGIDVNDAAMQQKYLDRFNLESKQAGLGGYLPLEFQVEGTAYTTGVLRPAATADGKIYRWGRPDITRPDWLNQWVKQYVPGGQNAPIMAFAHMIPLTGEQQANVKVFLENPDMRAKCKADNCVAWTSSIELGKTAKESNDTERNFLFSHLGMSRSMAHFEIARRLLHAANENNSVVMVFYNGEPGKVEFANNLLRYFPPPPKVPYISVIKDFFKTNPQADAAVGVIPDGSKVFLPIAAGASPDAMASLIALAAKGAKGLDVHVLVNGVSETLFRQGLSTAEGKFRVHALFLGGNLRKLYTEGRVNVIPGNLADFGRFVGDPATPQFNYDAIVVRVSPRDANGRYSLGPNHDHIMTILQKRPGIKIIAEVNENVPFTHGDNFLTDAQITSKFLSNTELAGPPVVPVGEVEANIGKNLGTLISPNATLQIGIGNVFGGFAQGVRDAGVRGLKIRTEMFGDALKDMMEAGVADVAETGFAYGTPSLYKWLNQNQKVTFKSTAEVNDPGKIGEIPNFHAVNTALQVDLYGQSNATIGPDGRRMSSPGGQVEFMTGAARSQGGKSIIAIRSTAKDGAISSIVMDLYPGPITTPHESVSHVVTEFGVAVLKGKSEQERAVALINVAHPKFRNELFEKAKAKGILRDGDRANIRFQ